MHSMFNGPLCDSFTRQECDAVHLKIACEVIRRALKLLVPFTCTFGICLNNCTILLRSPTLDCHHVSIEPVLIANTAHAMQCKMSLEAYLACYPIGLPTCQYCREN